MATSDEEDVSPYIEETCVDVSDEEGKQCYICLSNCNKEHLFCECKAPVHYECYRQYCEANDTHMCSICKTVPIEYRTINMQPIVTSEFNCLRFTVSYFSVFFFFSLIITISNYDDGLNLGHLINYAIMALFSVPVASMCGVKKTVDFRTTFEPVTV